MEEGRGDGEFFDFFAGVEEEPLEFGHGHVFGLASVHFLLITLEAVDGGLVSVERADMEALHPRHGDAEGIFGARGAGGAPAGQEDRKKDGKIESNPHGNVKRRYH